MRFRSGESSCLKNRIRGRQGGEVRAAATTGTLPEGKELRARRAEKGKGAALMVCLPLVVFPLGWQFFGPQSYT
ncbi:hypothetical protein, partial [Streptomyces zhihengii]